MILSRKYSEMRLANLSGAGAALRTSATIEARSTGAANRPGR